MEKTNIIVIGASTGGFAAITRLVSGLPADLEAAIFIVCHISPDAEGLLPQVLNRVRTIHAANAIDKEPVVMNRIYVAPPDNHMTLENGLVRIARGPKENRFRPAVDPLFRSAAHFYGSRVIGVILSGALGDGAAGMWTIKDRGGITVVQDPADAEAPSMPETALAAVKIDHCLPLSAMAPLLVKLAGEPAADNKKQVEQEENKKTSLELRIATLQQTVADGIPHLGQLTSYACPECHGVLSVIKEGDIVRYRCHTGHAYSIDSLLLSITENIEETLWGAVRGVEESIILLNNLGDSHAEKNQPMIAAAYFQKAHESQTRANLVRQAIAGNERLTATGIDRQADPVTA